MSLDISLHAVRRVEVYDANITHNLNTMAKEAGIYQHLWHPEILGIEKAEQLIVPLQFALAQMMADPERFKKFDSPNGWGRYVHFVPWLEKLLKACQEFPDADISVSI